MKDLRLLGSTIRKLSSDNGVSEEKIQEVLGCSCDQISAIFDGRVFPSFGDLRKLASLFGVAVEDMLHGDEEYYDASVVHCMGAVSDPKNREDILDIIEDYLKLLDAAE